MWGVKSREKVLKLSSKSRGITSRSVGVRLRLLGQEHGGVVRAKLVIQSQINTAQCSRAVSMSQFQIRA